MTLCSWQNFNKSQLPAVKNWHFRTGTLGCLAWRKLAVTVVPYTTYREPLAKMPAGLKMLKMCKYFSTFSLRMVVLSFNLRNSCTFYLRSELLRAKQSQFTPYFALWTTEKGWLKRSCALTLALSLALHTQTGRHKVVVLMAMFLCLLKHKFFIKEIINQKQQNKNV